MTSTTDQTGKATADPVTPGKQEQAKDGAAQWGAPSGEKRPPVLRNRDFRLLFTGETVSLFGSEVSVVALPLLAVLVFGAGALEVGLLAALQWIPFVLLGPIAGVLTDRMRKRPLMIAANIGRTLALGWLPVAAVAGILDVWQLYLVAVIKGVLDVVFQLSYQAHLPGLLDRADLMDANSKTQLSRSVATVFGRSLGGVLVGALGAARTIVVDAASYVVSTVCLLMIRKPEPAPQSSGRGVRSAVKDLGLGFSSLFGNRLLRSLTMMGFFGNTAVSLSIAMLIVFASDDLGFGPAELGIALGIGGAAFVVGAIFSRRITAALGLGRTLLFTHVLLGVALALLAIAPSGGLGFVVVAVSQFLSALTTPIANVGIMTIVQKATPMHLMGRIGGVSLPLVWGANALGPVLGAVLASQIGFRPTFVIAGVLAVLAIGWIVAGSIQNIRDDVPEHLRAGYEPEPAAA
jgi:MFS family permease